MKQLKRFPFLLSLLGVSVLLGLGLGWWYNYPVQAQGGDYEVQPPLMASAIALQKAIIEPNVPVTTVTPGTPDDPGTPEDESTPAVTTTTYHVVVQAEIAWTKNGAAVKVGTRGARSAGSATPRKLAAAWTVAGNLLTAMKAGLAGGVDL